MLKRVVITNYLGESMEYKIEGVQPDEDPSGFLITSIEGLGPVKANVNMLEPATRDGGIFNSARLSTRNIVIQGLFTNVSTIEEARLLSYKYFPIKKKLKIYIETDARRVQTEGYVESNEPTIFADKCGCQVSILCEDAYLDGGKMQWIFSDTIPLLKFAVGNESLDEPLIKVSENAEVTDVREIVYDGEAETGMVIDVDVPSDDIMDTFNVTGIEILGENNQKISIDTSKMVNQVPNTSPTSLSLKNVMFAYRQGKYKFLNGLNELKDFNTAGKVYSFSFKGDLYICYLDSIKHRRVVDPFTGSAHTEYLLRVCKWNDNSWERVDIPDYYLFSRATPIVYNDSYVYIFSAVKNEYQTVESGYPTWTFGTVPYYIKWDGTNWSYGIGTYLLDNTSTWGTIAPHPALLGDKVYFFYRQSYSSFDINTERYEYNIYRVPSDYVYYTDTFFVTYDGYIYTFAYDRDTCTKTNIDTWEEGPTLPYRISTSAGGQIIVFNNTIHIFGFGTKRSSTDDTWEDTSVKHYYLLDGDWVDYGDTLPCPVFSVTEIGDMVYLLNGDNSYTYTEDPNNDHLIENDKLVINTNKGKKGLTLYRGTNQYNVLNALEKDSTWLQLHRGVNKFSYDAATDADKLQITISTNKWYEGV